MQITFLGGADEVGASSILIEMGGKRLLVDAGIRPSPKARWGLAGDHLPDLSLLDQGGLDAILVTHAHTDHTGALELVVERFPGCPVYATPVTIALTRVLHADSRRIMQARLDEEGELPLFDEVATQKLMSAFVPVPFNTRLPLADGLAATFYLAGHIAGAACIALESDDGRVLISGDVSITPQRTVDGLRPPPFRPDVLILESTYGGRLHANRAVEERRMAEAISEVTSQGGKVLIPAFALGRAQEVLLALSELRRRGEFPPVAVWADGMVRAICQAYSQFPDALPLALQERGAQFFDEHVRPITRPDQRNGLLFDPAPAVIVSSSGMLAGGPSVHYARALAGQPQHAILLTGYQDEEAPGRRLQEMAAQGRGTLRLGKDRVEVQCRIGTYSLSAHADEGQLLSLTEALDPTEVFLVHGDEPARASLATALAARGRRVLSPRAGQSYQFSTSAAPVRRRAEAIGGVRALDVRALWRAIAEPGGGFFTPAELAAAWWGREHAGERATELPAALDAEGAHFAPEPGRPGLYRAQTRAQIDLSLHRRQAMASLPALAGNALLLRDPSGAPRVARCAQSAADHFLLDDEATPHWPDEVLDVLGVEADPARIEALSASLEPARLLEPGRPYLLADLPGEGLEARAALALATLRAGGAREAQGYLLRPSATSGARMEPNLALARARASFPPEARLRKAGYRLEGQVLTLTFDFPDAALTAQAAGIQQLQVETGWQVEVEREANQTSLSALVREVLPQGWSVVKGPAIHRAERQVAVSVTSPASTRVALNQAAERFREISGWELIATVVATVAVPPPGVRPAPTTGTGQTLEINAAYAAIKHALAGSTLYRTSLKGGEIVLSFISPRVGQRHLEAIQALSAQIGWPLSISPQANQNAIMETARLLLAQAGWTAAKGPSIFLDRGEVSLTLSRAPDESHRAALAADFEAQTGFRLIVSAPAPESGAPALAALPDDAVEIVRERIQLTAHQRSLTLDPEKTRKAVERAQRAGQISPPLRVRRVRDGYMLTDGLYRLRAAEKLGWEKVAAVVE